MVLKRSKAQSFLLPILLLAGGFIGLVAATPYLYSTDSKASAIIEEYTETTGKFLESTSPRVVEFYSPSCVSRCHIRSDRLCLRYLSSIQCLMPMICDQNVINDSDFRTALLLFISTKKMKFDRVPAELSNLNMLN